MGCKKNETTNFNLEKISNNLISAGKILKERKKEIRIT